MGKGLTVVLIERKEQYSTLQPPTLRRCCMGGGTKTEDVPCAEDMRRFGEWHPHTTKANISLSAGQRWTWRKAMAEYFAGGHLRFVNGEWRDDNGNAIEISRVRHGRWIASHDEFCSCSICKYPVYVGWNQTNYCPNCGAKMDGCDGNSAMT